MSTTVVAYDQSSGRVIFDDVATFDTITEKWIDNEHPWISDIRSMSKMLRGEIELPHDISSSKRRGRRRQASQWYQVKKCQECLRAAKLKRAYNKSLE